MTVRGSGRTLEPAFDPLEVPAMFAKLVDATIDPARLDLVAAVVDAELIPAFLEHDGALHGYWSADARTGHVLAVTMWRDAEALRAAAAADGSLRATVGERIGLGLRSVHALPVLAWTHEADAVTDPAEVGWVRLDWRDRAAPGGSRADEADVGDPASGCAGRYWIGEDGSRDRCLLSLWSDAAAPSVDGHAEAGRRRRERTHHRRPVHEYRTFGVARPAWERSPMLTELAGV